MTTTVAEADRKWEEFCDALAECENEVANRERQLEQFEALKAVVGEWLQTMQAKMESLEPMALNVTTLQRQMTLLEASINHPLIARIEYHTHNCLAIHSF